MVWWHLFWLQTPHLLLYLQCSAAGWKENITKSNAILCWILFMTLCTLGELDCFWICLHKSYRYRRIQDCLKSDCSNLWKWFETYFSQMLTWCKSITFKMSVYAIQQLKLKMQWFLHIWLQAHQTAVVFIWSLAGSITKWSVQVR